MGSLPMREEIGERINEILLNFVRGNDRLIERRRQLLCKTLGGYGMMDVNIMNVCIKASWVERWKRELPEIDYIAAIIWNQQDGYETWRVDSRKIRGIGLRIMEDIVIAWEKFKVCHYEWGNNINRAEIFSNRVLNEDGELMEERVFSGKRQNEVMNVVRGKTLGDIHM
jgi:hypothetical protein